MDFGQLTTWIAAHTSAYYGPALLAFGTVYHFSNDFSHRYVRNLLRGMVFALLIGSKFVVTPAGISPVPLWQHALSGSAGFALVALVFWTVGGVGLCLLLDAVLEVLKQATKALRNTAINAALLMAFGAIGALATAPLGRMIDERFAPPPIDIPPSAVAEVVEKIAADAAAAPASAAAGTTPAAGATTAAASTAASAAPSAAPATAPAPAATPTTAPTPTTTPAPSPATNP